MEKLVVSVSQLNNYLKGLFDEIPVFRSVYVSGEVSNFTDHYRTGHLYFSLKDEGSVIKAVMFNSYASRLKFKPENGMEVLVKARLTVYEKAGTYQLYVEDMQPKGAGALNFAFEQLKEKLSKEGLFDAAHKKELPRYPETVGVITSPTGAAVKDIKDVLLRRFPIINIKFEPVLVQGENAPEQLCRAIKKLDKENCDIIIVGRGGGSAEDLFAFNSEELARTVFDCKTPVISAVGHETDFTIIDFVADLRAPTPSAAAELAVPDFKDVCAYLSSLKSDLNKCVNNKLSQARYELEILKNKPALANVDFIFNEQRMNIDLLLKKMFDAVNLKLITQKQKFLTSAEKLDALSPLKVLLRGYSVALYNGKAITDSKKISTGDDIELYFASGKANCKVTGKEDNDE